MDFSELDLDPFPDCLRTLGLDPDTSGNCREILDDIDFRCLSFIVGYFKGFYPRVECLAIPPS